VIELVEIPDGLDQIPTVLTSSSRSPTVSTSSTTDPATLADQEIAEKRRSLDAAPRRVAQIS
jgi:hypothetical protein